MKQNFIKRFMKLLNLFEILFHLFVSHLKLCMEFHIPFIISYISQKFQHLWNTIRKIGNNRNRDSAIRRMTRRAGWVFPMILIFIQSTVLLELNVCSKITYCNGTLCTRDEARFWNSVDIMAKSGTAFHYYLIFATKDGWFEGTVIYKMFEA